jgi:Transposase DDE domain
MPTNYLYHNWFYQIRELRPGQRITQVRNFVWLMIGIYKSRSVSLSRIAGKIPGKAQLLSYTRRLSRFLDNPAIDVRAWYEPIARSWLERQAQTLQQVRLIVDGTKVGFGHQLLMVSLAYRKRSIPIAWSWVPHVRGHSTASTQLALLRYIRNLVPSGIAVLLVGDTEFGSIPILQQLDQWRWHYVLRQKTSTHVCLIHQTDWNDFGSWIEKAGSSIWLGKGWLTEKHIYWVNLLVHWKVGEKEPWCLATNLPDRQMALQAYARRMWIEEMFGDMKGHGFDLESTMLRHTDRLSRLTLAVVLLYVWLVSTGTRIIRDGLRYQVDRRDRRDLSIFQIGFRYIDRQLLNSLPFRILLCSYR